MGWIYDVGIGNNIIIGLQNNYTGTSGGIGSATIVIYIAYILVFVFLNQNTKETTLSCRSHYIRLLYSGHLKS